MGWPLCVLRTTGNRATVGGLRGELPRGSATRSSARVSARVRISSRSVGWVRVKRTRPRIRRQTSEPGLNFLRRGVGHILASADDRVLRSRRAAANMSLDVRRMACASDGDEAKLIARAMGDTAPTPINTCVTLSEYRNFEDDALARRIHGRYIGARARQECLLPVQRPEARRPSERQRRQLS